MLVRYDDDGLGVGDPLQSIRDIVVVSKTPKHKRVPPEKKHPHMLGHPTLPSGEIENSTYFPSTNGSPLSN